MNTVFTHAAALLAKAGSAITRIALFINSAIGRAALILLYFAVMLIAVAFNVIVIPFILHLFISASVRRPVIFIILAVLNCRGRREGNRILERLLKWWRRRHIILRVGVLAALATLVAISLAEAAGLFGLLYLLPLPIFATAFLKHELPIIIVRSMARMGIDKVIFKGGWSLLPLKSQELMIKGTNKAARAIIRCRKRITRLIIRKKKHAASRETTTRFESTT